MIFLVCAGPFGFYLLFRCILPLIWCFNFIYTNNDHHNIELVYLHTLFLLLNTYLCSKIIVYIAYFAKTQFNLVEINKKYSSNQIGFWLAVILFITLFIVLGNRIPIFADGGSNAILELSRQSKTSTWLIFGIIDLLILYFLVIFNSQKKRFYKFISFFLSLFGSISSGSKVGVVAFFGKLFTIQALFRSNTFSFSKLMLLLISLPLSLGFIVYQFARTLDISINFNSVVGVLTSLVYSSSTSYLNQFIARDGVMLSSQYSQMLGEFGFMTYFLNPFLVVFGYDGIGQSIGPYLSGNLYGQFNDGGVNPTLFFEFIFIFGPSIGIPMAFLIAAMIFSISKRLINLAIFYKSQSNMLAACLIGISFLCLTFLTDTLNAIRTMPFFLVPFFFVIIYMRIFKSKKIT